MPDPAADRAAPSALSVIESLNFHPVFRRLMIASAFAAVMVLCVASARSDDEFDSASDDDLAEPDHLDEFYRPLGLAPYLERRIQAILEAEWEEARVSAQKVGLRRMSLGRYRQKLVALDRSTDAKIRALIGPKKFLAWQRARTDPMRDRTGRAAAAASLQRPPGRPAPPAGARAPWTPDRCAGLGRLLRGPTLAKTTAEEVHFWIHDHAQHC